MGSRALGRQKTIASHTKPHMYKAIAYSSDDLCGTASWSLVLEAVVFLAVDLNDTDNGCFCRCIDPFYDLPLTFPPLVTCHPVPGLSWEALYDRTYTYAREG